MSLKSDSARVIRLDCAMADEAIVTVSRAVTIARPNSGNRGVGMAGSFPWWTDSKSVRQQPDTPWSWQVSHFARKPGRLLNCGSLDETCFFLEQQFPPRG
jgi:hypothetical protein